MITLEKKPKLATKKAVASIPDRPEGKRGPGPDPLIWLFSALLTVIGCVVIFDAGFARSIQSGAGVIPTEFRNQALFGVVSGFVAWGVSRVKGTFWQKGAWWLFGLSFLGLLAVKVIGFEMNGAQRWIRVGPFTVQPSEFMKVAAIVLVAAVLAARQPWKSRKTKDWAEYMDKVAVPKFLRLLPAIIVMVAVYVIEREPDLGTAAVVGATAYAMFAFGGITKKSLILVSLVGALIVGALVMKEPFRMERVTNHFHRWEADRIDDVGYQTVQSEIAMASGGWIGVGPGAGRVKHLMPAATTDFVFATVAEETGFLGVAALLALMGGLVYRLYRLGVKCANVFARHVCLGVALWLTIQATVNLMMANGFLPPIGIPFPFISSGGSSLLAMLVAIGICQSVANLKEGEEVANRHHRRRNGRTRLSRA